MRLCLFLNRDHSTTMRLSLDQILIVMCYLESIHPFDTFSSELQKFSEDPYTLAKIAFSMKEKRIKVGVFLCKSKCAEKEKMFTILATLLQLNDELYYTIEKIAIRRGFLNLIKVLDKNRRIHSHNLIYSNRFYILEEFDVKLPEANILKQLVRCNKFDSLEYFAKKYIMPDSIIVFTCFFYNKKNDQWLNKIIKLLATKISDIFVIKECLLCCIAKKNFNGFIILLKALENCRSSAIINDIIQIVTSQSWDNRVVYTLFQRDPKKFLSNLDKIVDKNQFEKFLEFIRKGFLDYDEDY